METVLRRFVIDKYLEQKMVGKGLTIHLHKLNRGVLLHYMFEALSTTIT